MLITVHADDAEYWSTDGPKPVIFFKFITAAFAGGQPDIGENKTVDLSLRVDRSGPVSSTPSAHLRLWRKYEETCGKIVT